MNIFLKNYAVWMIACVVGIFYNSYPSLSTGINKKLQQITITIIYLNESEVCEGGYENPPCLTLFDRKNINIEELFSSGIKSDPTIVKVEKKCDFLLTENLKQKIHDYIDTDKYKERDYKKRKSILVVFEWEGKRKLNTTISKVTVNNQNERQQESEVVYTLNSGSKRTLVMFHRRAEEFDTRLGHSWEVSIKEKYKNMEYKSQFTFHLRDVGQLSNYTSCSSINS
ncbi:hypothetical protein [Aphanothece sacrum]|uniref:Uncharacterized protein n=1 Tax=Aphanothece sacrum FPU1 TaxID=1920663 RepID=A0A401IH97_APHSA|nr:hypothetical protein [Aphanothece sacrum]GBF80609.1 hypothetical protein AsFPU1_2013 [Aphanothece sacrum FPU1]GBF84001.1 hypothetical protein AsFPU3_1045 [Aphanothece sacrum FPU3]